MDNHIAKEHAYAVTMAVSTMVEAMGMQAENQERLRRGAAGPGSSAAWRPRYRVGQPWSSD